MKYKYKLHKRLSNKKQKYKKTKMNKSDAKMEKDIFCTKCMRKFVSAKTSNFGLPVFDAPVQPNLYCEKYK